MFLTVLRILRFATIAGLSSVLQPMGAQAHSLPKDEALTVLQGSPDRADRINRMSRLESYRLAPGLRQRALFKLGNTRLEAEGLSPSERARTLSRGTQRAFPYVAQPELGSVGRKRTVTVLVDFTDLTAATLNPGVTADGVSANIYGTGTATAQNFVPFESLHNYYRRASENKLDLGGDVLGWVHLSKERTKYQPVYPAGATDQEKSTIDNQALFDLMSEALDKVDADTDFTQYDNDQDGDIDLITVLYAGPNNGWGGFWWAYQWKFFVPAAFSKTFDGKRLKQFVFSFVDVRSSDDFAPNTLIHEYGHALGLPDLYDYCSSRRFANGDCPSWVTDAGPDGGLGGLDIMDGNTGNHNALNRWLLDWIEPKVILGSGETINLIPSGAESGGIKAIAMFPGLQQTNTPGQELFLIENRSRVGNDSAEANMPSDGLIIWHVDATPTTDRTDFGFDNSFSQHKLIRLVRAQTDADFGLDDRANALDYYVPGKRFAPDSIPSSASYAEQGTGVSVSDIQVSGTTVSAKVGYVGPIVVASARQPTMTRGATRMAAWPSTLEIDLAALEKRNEEFRTSTPGELAKRWAENTAEVDLSAPDTEQTILAQLVLTHWAGKDGLAATNALLALPRSEFTRRVFPEVMAAWAYNDPKGANDWYFAPAQADLRKDPAMTAGEAFTSVLFRWRGQSEPKTAASAIEALESAREIYGAVEGLREAAAATGSAEATVESQLDGLGAKSDKARALLKLQDALKDTKQQFQERPGADQTGDIIRQRLP